MDYADLTGEIRPFATNVPEFLAVQSIRKSVIEFCERTKAWEVLLDTVPFVADQVTYDLELPDGSVLVQVTEGPDMTVDLEEMTFTLDVAPIEDISTIKVAVKPSIDSDSFPDSIGNLWTDCIASGALKKILAAPGLPWSNPELSDYHARLFEEGVDKAIIARSKGFTSRATTIRPANSYSTV